MLFIITQKSGMKFYLKKDNLFASENQFPRPKEKSENNRETTT